MGQSCYQETRYILGFASNFRKMLLFRSLTIAIVLGRVNRGSNVFGNFDFFGGLSDLKFHYFDLLILLGLWGQGPRDIIAWPDVAYPSHSLKILSSK
jgi:hypothetical protein